MPSVDNGATAVSWQEAEQRCQNVDAHLVVIDSERERSFLQSQLPNGVDQLWIGLNDINEEGNYVWVDGLPLNYHFWAQGQPRDVSNSQNCAEMNGNSGDEPAAWHVTYCNSRQGYICQKLLGKMTHCCCLSYIRASRLFTVDTPVSHTGPGSMTTLAPCPNGTMTFGSSCYVITPSCRDLNCTLDWNSARASCRAAYNVSDLLSIHSLAELQFVRRWAHHSTYKQMWIGLNDAEVEGRYVWSDNSTTNNTELYWQSNEPDDKHHSLNCVALSTADGMFSDENCHSPLPYACKFARHAVSGACHLVTFSHLRY